MSVCEHEWLWVVGCGVEQCSKCLATHTHADLRRQLAAVTRELGEARERIGEWQQAGIHAVVTLVGAEVPYARRAIVDGCRRRSG